MKRAILTIAETARITGWNIRRTREAVKTGALPSIKVGRRAYVVTAKLEEMLQIRIPVEFFSEELDEA